MPAFLTHWRILIETARHSQDAGNDLGSLIIDATALRRRAHGWSTPPSTTPAGAVWDTGPLPEIDFRFPGSDISSMAFLGAMAQDVMYYHRRYFRAKLTDAYLRASRKSAPAAERPPQWSELFHHAHSGDILILFLEQVALVPSPALRSQALAFALGYVSHIAADIALNPWISAQAARLPRQRVPGSHFALELCLDEYMAASYFGHPRYGVLYQPWGEYIEPAVRSLGQPDSLFAQLLRLLASAAETYQLSEEQTEALPRDFLAGLQGLRFFLAGRGRARWLALLAGRRAKSARGPLDILDSLPKNEETVSFEQVMNYAIRLSERLCRCAINYYTALRNPQVEASERSSRRAALVSDLRNWDLHTGYATEEAAREAGEATRPALHNWVYFSDLWERSADGQEQLSRLIGQPR